MSVLPRTQLGYTLELEEIKIFMDKVKSLLKTLLSKVEVVLEWQEIDEWISSLRKGIT